MCGLLLHQLCKLPLKNTRPTTQTYHLQPELNFHDLCELFSIIFIKCKNPSLGARCNSAWPPSSPRRRHLECKEPKYFDINFFDVGSYNIQCQVIKRVGGGWSRVCLASWKYANDLYWHTNILLAGGGWWWLKTTTTHDRRLINVCDSATQKPPPSSAKPPTTLRLDPLILSI